MVKKTVTIWIWAAGACLTMLIILAIAYEITFYQKAYPGLEVADVEAGGLNKNQIINLLTVKNIKFNKLTLKWGANEWVVTPEELGVVFDISQTAQNVVEAGRIGNIQSRTWTKYATIFKGTIYNPVVIFDLPKFEETIASISGQINIPAKEPEIIKITTPPGVLVTRGENGQEVNTGLLKSRIIATAAKMQNSEIEIPVKDIKPQLSDDQVEKIKSEASLLLGKELVLNLEAEGQSWTVRDEQMLTWIDLPSGDWNKTVIRGWAEELAKTIDRAPQDANFRWIGGENKVEEFRPAKNGLALDVDHAAQNIVFGLNNIKSAGVSQKAELKADYVPPSITNSDVNDLGIKELVGKGESWFTGSITNRIFNLKKAADVLNGKLVAPGDTFSFNQAVGEVSADTGYKQAYIIKEGKTILGDGGGVCQVSTVLFRAVLDAGLPIPARTPHAYRVSYYEVNYQPGFDATVFQPAPDFKFINDTPAYVLIQAVYDEAKKYLAFEIYGTSDGRIAEISKARIWEVISPPPDLYIDDPNLPIGKVVQTEHAARGAKVAFDWKVTRGEEVLQERTFFSNYRPWQAVYLRGIKVN